MAVCKLLIQEPPLQVLPTLALHIGLNEAIVLQQLHYWLLKDMGKKEGGRTWVYNTLEDWKKQFPFWSEKTIRRTLSNLTDKKLVEAKSFNLNKFDHTKWYTINYDVLEDIEKTAENKQKDNASVRSGQNDQIDMPEMANRDGQNDRFRSGQNDQIDADKMTSSYIMIHRLQDIDSHRTGARDPKETFSEEVKEEKKTISKTTSEKMIEIWNEVVEDGAGIVSLTLKRKAMLDKALKQTFGNDVREWTQYCSAIKHSPFLMGQSGRSDWRVSLDWALAPDNRQKVLEGVYGKGRENVAVATEKVKSPVPNFLEETKVREEEILSRKDASNSLKRTMVFLLNELGVKKFDTWFKELREGDVRPDNVILKAPSAFVADYVRQNYSGVLERAAQGGYGRSLGVDVQ